MVLEIATLVGAIPPMITVGFVSVSWAAPPAVLAFIPGAASSRIAHRPMHSGETLLMVALLGLLLASCLLYAQFGGGVVAGWIFMAVGVEEVLYRLALPAIFTAAMLRLGYPETHSLIAALIISATIFVLMPGHVVQIAGLGAFLEIICFSALMSYAMWVGRLFLPVVAAHATVDYLTFAMHHGDLSAIERGTGVATTLGLMTAFALVRREVALPSQAPLGVQT